MNGIPESIIVLDQAGITAVGPAEAIKAKWENSKRELDSRLLHYERGAEAFMQSWPDGVFPSGIGYYEMPFRDDWLGVASPALTKSVMQMLDEKERGIVQWWDSKEQKWLDDWQAFDAAVESLPCCTNQELWRQGHAANCPKEVYAEIRQSLLQPHHEDWEEFPTCNGSGLVRYVLNRRTHCFQCKGTGEVPE